VFEAECELYPDVINRLAKGEFVVHNGRVRTRDLG
jgi:hypothetical protein